MKGGGDVPGYPEFELRLYGAEAREDAEHAARGGEDDEEPEVELCGGPAVFAPDEAHLCEVRDGACHPSCSLLVLSLSF